VLRVAFMNFLCDFENERRLGKETKDEKEVDESNGQNEFLSFRVFLA
jgi:hypothetical protein